MKTKKNRSEIASSFPAVARLDLSHVSENKGFGKTNLYVIKTKFICCRDKKLGARAERARRGFFSPKKRHSYPPKLDPTVFDTLEGIPPGGWGGR